MKSIKTEIRYDLYDDNKAINKILEMTTEKYQRNREINLPIS